MEPYEETTALDDYNRNPDALALKLHDGLNATRTHFFAHEGQVISEREVIDFKTRATYLDIAYRLLGSYKESAAMPPGGWPGPVIYLPEKQSKNATASGLIKG